MGRFFMPTEGVWVVENGRIDMLFELVQQMRVETNRRFDRLEDNLMRRLDNHDERINALEDRHAQLEGKVKAWAAMISAGVSAAVKWLLPGQGGQ